MKVVVIDANWACRTCGRWIKPRNVRLTQTIGVLGHCDRDGLVYEPQPRPYRVRIEEDAA